jgi:hypothetical protein
MWYAATALVRSPVGAALLDSSATRRTPPRCIAFTSPASS